MAGYYYLMGKQQTAGVVLNKMKLLVGKYRMVTWLALVKEEI